MDIIKARVRSLREHRNWSQEDLARESGLKRPHISLIETGDRIPGAKTLVKLADALGTSLDFLTGRTDNPAAIPSVNHPALKDPDFAALAALWPRLADSDKPLILDTVRRFVAVPPGSKKKRKHGEM
jgi:transcriptional regulator with XRE-family HTH domain